MSCYGIAIGHWAMTIILGLGSNTFDVYSDMGSGIYHLEAKNVTRTFSANETVPGTCFLMSIVHVQHQHHRGEVQVLGGGHRLGGHNLWVHPAACSCSRYLWCCCNAVVEMHLSRSSSPRRLQEISGRIPPSAVHPLPEEISRILDVAQRESCWKNYGKIVRLGPVPVRSFKTG